MSRTRTHIRFAPALALVGAAAALATHLPASDGAHARPSSASGLPNSSASAHAVQRQPLAGTCHARGSGIYARPDARCTPGALNPAVTQAMIAATICRRGWTRTVRPPVSVTEPEKLASMRAYGDGAQSSRFEYDHLVALELGGAANDARNLWPEPDYASRSGFYLNPKDELERALNRLVCRGQIALARAQRLICSDWPAAFRRYG